jgi:isoaspartyl peptidase/L-asparaginase-like protein (Ntn-hydrolase superfamily)
MGGEGGLIGVDNKGEISLVFNSEGMYRGWAKSLDDIQTSIYR